MIILGDKWKKIRGISKFKDLSTIGAANLIGSIIAGIFWFYLATLIPEEEYGQISYIISIAAITGLISSIGGGGTIIVYTAKKIPIQSTVFFISIIVGSIGSIIVYFIIGEIAASFYVIGYVIFGLANSDMLGRKQYSEYSKLFVIQKLLFAVSSIGLYFIFGPSGVVLGFAVSFIPYTWRIIKTFKEIKIDFSILRPRIRFMRNAYASDLARGLTGHLDRLIIGPLFGFVILGNYYLGIQILSLLSLLPTILIQYILPQESSGIKTVKLKKYAILLSIVISALGVVLAPIGIPWMFPKYEDAIMIVQIFSISIIPTTVATTFISKFLAKEESGIVLTGVICYLIAQVVAIIILGNMLGAVGLAISLVIGTISQMFYFIIKNRQISFNKK